jgi:hypothetical protein
MASIEQDLMVMLRQLPIAITISWQSNRYHWQCAEGHGSSPDLVEATGQALKYLIAFLASDISTVADFPQSLHDSHATTYP